MDSILCQMHVTAVCIHENLAFAGNGNSLEIYNVTDVSLLKKQCVIPNLIHGIKIKTDFDSKNESPGEVLHMCVHGGKCLCVFEVFVKDDVVRLNIKSSNEFADWIWDVAWLNESSLLAVVLAHNYVVFWDIVNNQTVETIACDVNCILYSATFIGSKLENLMLAVGTVFQEIILWSPTVKFDSYTNTETSTSIKTVKHFHRLSGHQGVIFSINYNADVNKLCSTSDDRSARVWSVSFQRKPDEHDYGDRTSDEWIDAEFNLILVLYGHEARVWQSVLLSQYLITVGEDSLMCVWNYDGKLMKKLSVHKGGGIWSIACNSHHVITGGGDGGICLWNLNNDLLEATNDSHVICLPHLTSSNPTIVTRITERNLVVITEAGELLTYDEMDKCWDVLLSDEIFSTYCVVSYSEKTGILALATISGYVVFLTISPDAKLLQKSRTLAHDGKVYNVKWLDDETLLTAGPDGEMKTWSFYGNDNFRARCKLILPYCKQRWFSAASVFYDKLVVGDRNGNIHVYDSFHPDAPQVPGHTYSHIHGRLGVTCFQQSVNSSSVNDQVEKYSKILYSSGRNGIICMFKLGIDCKLLLLRTFKLTRGPDWIVGIKISVNSKILYAFQSTNFVVWNFEQQRLIVKIDCGGGHRSWDYNYVKWNDNVSKHRLVCVRDKQLWSSSIRTSSVNHHLKDGLHGREINAVKIIDTGDHLSRGDLILATASEDTTVNIVGVESDGRSFKISCTLTTHLSNVKTIGLGEWFLVDGEQRARIMVTAGGRAQLVCWKLLFNHGNLDVQELCSHMLEMPHSKKPWLKDKASNLDVKQIRFMDVNVLATPHRTKHVIVAACSDGLVRTFNLNLTSSSIDVGRCFTHGANCILKLSNYRSAQHSFIISAGTDGRLNFWNSADLFKYDEIHDEMFPLTRVVHHQSGVNSLDVIVIEGDRILVATGGDDNSLVVSSIGFDPISLAVNDTNKTFVVESTVSIVSAHASQITGLKFPNTLDIGHYLVTASIDQRIVLWTWQLAGQTLTVCHVSTVLSNIPDISSLDVICHSSENERNRNFRLLVAGEGLEYFDFNL